MSFRSIKADEMDGNLIKLIRDQWMLTASGSKVNANSMIGNWGFLGEISTRLRVVC